MTRPAQRWRGALFAVCLAAWPAVGCASGAPFDTDVDDSAGSVAVTILGDGFVRTAGRRIALERLILELRQRARRMTDDELGRFVVEVDYAPTLDPASRRRADADFDRLVLEVDVMDLGYVRFR